MDPMMEASIDRHLEKAVRFHGHLCGGQVIGVRMAILARNRGRWKDVLPAVCGKEGILYRD